MASSAPPISGPPVLRIKRLRSEDPVEALLIHHASSSKRQRIQFDLIVSQAEPEPNDLRGKLECIKARTTPRSVHGGASRRRADRKAASSSSRYELFSQNRSGIHDLVRVKEEQEKEEPRKKDSERLISCNETPLLELKEDYDYVYDFYASMSSTTEKELDFSNVFAYESYLVPVEESLDSDQESEDDSNDENNFRNDYPDEEGGSSSEDFDYEEGFERLRINELSSSSENGGLYWEEDVRLGSAYSEYKRRIALEDDEDRELD